MKIEMKVNEPKKINARVRKESREKQKSKTPKDKSKQQKL